MTLATIMIATAVNYTVQTACHPDDVKTYDTAKLRERFVMEKVMEPDRINLTYTMYDRLVYGGAMPVKGELTLDTFEELKAENFLDRRELGVINVGGPGEVEVKVKGEGEQRCSIFFSVSHKKGSAILCSPSPLTFTSTTSAALLIAKCVAFKIFSLSISAGLADATAQTQPGVDLMTSASAKRFFSDSFFESLMPLHAPASSSLANLSGTDTAAA